MPQAKDHFRQVLLEAVDEGLLILGESSRKAIYFHLQNKFSLVREDIPDRPTLFTESLRKIFGAGAGVIEEAIAKSLCGKLGIEYREKKNACFADYLNDTRKQKAKHSAESEEAVLQAEKR